MKEIYCIASGEYSDWGINYSFESEEKRDKLLNIIGDSGYHKYDLKLHDDEIDIDNVKIIYIAEIDWNWKDRGLEVYFRKTNNVYTKITNKKKVYIHRNNLTLIQLKITKDQYEKGEKYYFNKFKKIWQDTEAKIKYMNKVGGISFEDIEKILNKEEY